MKKLTLILVTILAIALVFSIGAQTVFAEEVEETPVAAEIKPDTDETAADEETDKAELNAEYVANIAVEKILAALNEDEKTSNFAEWVDKYKAELISALSGLLGVIVLLLMKYLQKSQNAGALSQIKLFNKLQGESEAIQTAVAKIDDQSEEFSALKATVTSQAATIIQLREELQKSERQTSNAVKNIAEMLYKAYAASNLAENVKDSIIGNYNKIANFDDTAKNAAIEKAKEVLNEVSEIIDSAKA